MARGTQTHSVWDLLVADLRLKRCSFRMIRKKQSKYVYIRQMEGKKVVREFTSGRFLYAMDEHLYACAEACMEAHKAGRWLLERDNGGGHVITWRELISQARSNLRQRVAREGSRKNAEGHFNELEQMTGKVTTAALERWAKQKSPITEPSAFRNRLETLSHINKAGVLDLKDSLERLKALRPTGASKKENERRTQEIKAIPTDEALEAFLDGLDGHIQWTLALIATYGLRPSEAWHAEGIDAQGWITVPGDGLTKTARHFAPPVPAHWLDRYQLRENFEKYQKELNGRWRIRWEDRKGLLIPVNNSGVTNSLWRCMKREKIQLFVGDEWVRPYDLRHSYAIRCETSSELIDTPSEEFAKWLGHGAEVHKRVYLRFMSKDREKASLQARYAKNPAEGAGLSDEILAKLKKLEQLEALLSS